jgi:hypothetical protein
VQKIEYVRRSFVIYLKSPGFTPYFNRMHPRPSVRYVIAVLLALSGVGFLLAIAIVIGGVVKSRRRRQKRRSLVEAAERSDLVMTVVLMANNLLNQPKGVIAPGLVIGSFEEGVTPNELAEIAGRVDGASLGEFGDEAQKAINDMMSDLGYREGRRRRLPEAITEGRLVYAFDLNIIGDFLNESPTELPLVSCLAEPGDEGTIQHIPTELLASAQEVEGNVASLAELYRLLYAVDLQRYDFAIGGQDRVTEQDLEKISRQLGFEIPSIYQAFLLKCGGFYIAAKQELWPQADLGGGLQTAPYWTFLHGFYVLGVGETVPPDMRLVEATKQLREQGVTDLLPFMQRTLEADCWCFDREGRIVRWDHEQPEERALVETDFGETVLHQFDELEVRLEKMRVRQASQEGG